MKKTPACGPGLSQGETNSECPPDNADRAHRQHRSVDPRAAILLRAAVRYDLLRAGLLDLDSVFDPQFVDDFLTATNACPRQRATVDHFDRIHREDREDRLRRWRDQS